MANITVKVPADVYRRAKIHAARSGTSVSALVADYLATLGDEAPARALGGWEGRVEIADDFDAPLPPSLQHHFEAHE